MPANRQIRSQRRDWEEVAGFNAEWAVLTVPEAKAAGWDMGTFFKSGNVQISEALAIGDELGLPNDTRSALDFGCGVGRFAPELSDRFDRYVGVDISGTMVERARELHAGRDNCEFIVNAEQNLGRFETGSFDGIFSFLVLQHMTNRQMIRCYLVELVRVLAPGGLAAIQLISHVPLAYRFRLRRKLYRLVRALGVGVDRAHRWGLQSMVLTPIGIDDVRGIVHDLGAEVRRHSTSEPGHGVRSTTYYLTKP